MSAAVIDQAPGAPAADVAGAVGVEQAEPSGSVLAWVLAEFAPVFGDAEVLTLQARGDLLRDAEGRWRVPVVAVHVHVHGEDRAGLVAAGLDLGAATVEVREVGEGRTWLTWSGWVPGACPDYPVSVTVVAASAADGADGAVLRVTS